MKSGSLNFLEPSGPLQACNGTALPITFTRQYLDISTGFKDLLAGFNIMVWKMKGSPKKGSEWKIS